MVGVIGVNRRIFSCLADKGISVFMVSQASSENSTSIGVRDDDAQEACRVLDEEFAAEIADGAMFPMTAERGLATVAIVGENMKHTPGIAGKLFGTLGRSGISVIACAQGASETNISFVINEQYLRKALNVIHDSFFLSEYQVLNLFVCGVGTVGGQLIEQISQQQEKLMRELRLKLNVVGIASGHNAMFDRNGLSLENFRDRLKKAPASDLQRLHDEVIGMNIFNSVFVDCTASGQVASLYADFLEHNINIVAANKIAASSDYANYRRLKDIAHKRGVKFLFETNVGASNYQLSLIKIIKDGVDLKDVITEDVIIEEGSSEKGILRTDYEKIMADYDYVVEKYNDAGINFDLFGIDLTTKPDFSFDIFNKWEAIWLLPIMAFLAQMLTSIVSMRINKRVNPDAPTMAGMLLFMPVISLIIGFNFPGGVCFYWICSSLIGGAIQSAIQILYGPHKLLARDREKELAKVCDFEAGQQKKFETETE